MRTRRPFRFAAGLFSAPSGTVWFDQARRIEDLGYDALAMGDHFHMGFAPALGLLAASMATTTLRVISTVFANDFRHPALLANEAATLDVLSGGRLEFGIGAGWTKAEYDAAGIPFDSPDVRVDRMMESLSIIKRLWGGETVQHKGTHYRIQDLRCPTRPVQQPHPPVYIGGGGKRMLSFAAREADTIGLLAKARPDGGLEWGTDETEAVLATKVDWIRTAAGDRFNQIELALLLWKVIVADDRQATAEAYVATDDTVTVEEVLGSPYYAIGSVEEVAEHLIDLRERFGVSHFSVFPEDVETFAPIVALLKGQ